MKKIIIIAFAVILGCIAVKAADISGVKIGLFNSSQARVLNNSFAQAETAINVSAIVVDTNVTTVVTAYTPLSVGQLLVGGAGVGTNAMWYADGLTTNDWNQIN